MPTTSNLVFTPPARRLLCASPPPPEQGSSGWWTCCSRPALPRRWSPTTPRPRAFTWRPRTMRYDKICCTAVRQDNSKIYEIRYDLYDRSTSRRRTATASCCRYRTCCLSHGLPLARRGGQSFFRPSRPGKGGAREQGSSAPGLLVCRWFVVGRCSVPWQHKPPSAEQQLAAVLKKCDWASVFPPL